MYGVLQMTNMFLPLLRRYGGHKGDKGQGRIVNMSSIAGRLCAVESAYCVSKAAVEALSDCWRRELYHQGVKG